MMLNSKNNQFVFYFPVTFWSEDVVNYYKSFYKELLLPYDNIEDFVLSTLQSMSFPGFKANSVRQHGWMGSERDYKGSETSKDIIEKSFQLTFKLTEGFFNYMLMYNQYIWFYDHKNKLQSFDPMILGLLNNEGFLMQTIEFRYPFFQSISNISLDYTSVENNFNKFTMNFIYQDWSITTYHDQLINLYEDI